MKREGHTTASDVKVAKNVAKDLGFDNSVIVAWNEEDNQYQIITYGKNKEVCKKAAKMGKTAWQAIYKALDRGEY